ncbi:hypothetical protein SMICM304S_02879 [Streptomyces microflavus]
MIEVPERTDAEGHTVRALELDSVREQLRAAHADGLRSAAVVLPSLRRHRDAGTVRKTPTRETVRQRAEQLCAELANHTRDDLRADGVPDSAIKRARVLLRYAGTDAALAVAPASVAAMSEEFTAAHRTRFGFTMEKPIVVETVSVEATGTSGEQASHREPAPREGPLQPRDTVLMYAEGREQQAPSTP